MRFNDYVALKSGAGRIECVSEVVKVLPLIHSDEEFLGLFARATHELLWRQGDRPFYNVYPIAIELCQKINLSMSWGDIPLPVGQIVLRFAEGNEPLGIKSALLRIPSPSSEGISKERSEAIDRAFNAIKKANDGKLYDLSGVLQFTNGTERIFAYGSEDLRNESIGKTASAMMGYSGSPEGIQDQGHFLVRMLAFIGMLARGTDLITPVILSKDREEYDASSDESRKRWLEERARKRQGIGFDVGRSMEIERSASPHWRSPHLALFHTGPGRTVPVLKVRSGCVVVPNDMSKVPTGFLGPESPGEQVEENSPRYRPSLPPKIRFFVLRRDKYTCRLCGMTADDGIKLHVDHIIPRAKGGTDDPENLQTTCQPCNSGKFTHDLHLPDSTNKEQPMSHHSEAIA